MLKSKTLQVLITFTYLFLFQIATFGASSSADTTKTAYDFYVSGNRLYDNGKYDDAVRAFEQSVQLDPDYYFARINLGVAMAKNREFSQAIQNFTYCIDEKCGSEADRFVFYFNRALARKESGQTQSTQKDWIVLKKLDPTRAEELQHVQEYIFMDALYCQRRNETDKNKLFQKHKASIAKERIVVQKIAGHSKNAEEYDPMGLIEGTLEEVTGILTDYKSYPAFMPNVKEISIRSSSDEGVIVDHKLGLPMDFVKKYRLRYWAKREENRIQLFWKKMPWPELKSKETVVDTWGQWILEEYPQQNHQILAYYRVYTDPGNIPLGTGWIVEIMTKDSIPNVIEQTRRRVKQMARSTQP